MGREERRYEALRISDLPSSQLRSSPLLTCSRRSDTFIEEASPLLWLLTELEKLTSPSPPTLSRLSSGSRERSRWPPGGRLRSSKVLEARAMKRSMASLNYDERC